MDAIQHHHRRQGSALMSRDQGPTRVLGNLSKHGRRLHFFSLQTIAALMTDKAQTGNKRPRQSRRALKVI